MVTIGYLHAELIEVALQFSCYTLPSPGGQPIFGVPGSNIHILDGDWDQEPETLAT